MKIATDATTYRIHIKDGDLSGRTILFDWWGTFDEMIKQILSVSQRDSILLNDRTLTISKKGEKILLETIEQIKNGTYKGKARFY